MQQGHTVVGNVLWNSMPQDLMCMFCPCAKGDTANGHILWNSMPQDLMCTSSPLQMEIQQIPLETEY